MLARYAVMLAAVSLLCATPASVLAAPKGQAATVNARQRLQRERRVEGARHGTLTRPEVGRLRRGAASIRREERLYRRHGLSRREARDLRRDLNRESRRIARLKHNGARR